jgi:hypothetical protein
MQKQNTSRWTDERRAQQSAAIHRWRPWESCRGPRTAEGKASSSKNAFKPDSFPKQFAAIRHDLACVNRMLKAIVARRRGRPKNRLHASTSTLEIAQVSMKDKHS